MPDTLLAAFFNLSGKDGHAFDLRIFFLRAIRGWIEVGNEGTFDQSADGGAQREGHPALVGEGAVIGKGDGQGCAARVILRNALPCPHQCEADEESETLHCRVLQLIAVHSAGQTGVQ